MCNPFVRGVLLATTLIVSNMGYQSSAEAASCKGASKLGVHRTVNLSTTGGARFGSSHGGHRNFLKAKEVVLTFDDGPNPATTNKVLHALETHCAKATFFMVGSMVRANASTAKKVAAKGHTVGVHSDTHKNLGRLNANSAIKDVDRSIVTINNKVGRNVARFFRFPYLSENQSVNRHLSRKNYGVFAIDVDSLDYRINNANSLVNRIMSQLRKQGNKGIILMHDTKKVTARATGMLLSRLHKEGYKLVHIRGRSSDRAPEPVVIASADNIKVAETNDGPLIVARADTRTKKRSQAIKRKTVELNEETVQRSFTQLRGVPEKPKAKKVLTKKPAKKKKPVRVASLAKPKPVRAKAKAKPVKKIKVSNKRKVQPPKKKVSTRKQRQNSFRERQKKVIAKINSRNKKFREAMKARFITN